MAALQYRHGSYRVLFRFTGKQHSFTLGNVEESEAAAKAKQVDYLLMRLKQRLINLPAGVDIVTFVEHDGRPPNSTSGAPATRRPPTLAQLRDRYLETFANGTIEASTLSLRQIHFRHLFRILGDVPLSELTHERLQEYINRRASQSKKNKVGEVTIRKEIATLRAAWNWGCRSNLAVGQLPNRGLRYPKAQEKPPFMTREEIERQIRLGAGDEFWECLYLQIDDIVEVLKIAKERASHPFIYPMFCMAAYTGARRSELLASLLADFDFASGMVVIREKKRLQGKTSTRRVPLSPLFAEVMKAWFTIHPGGPLTFAKAPLSRSRTKKAVGEPLTRNEAHDHFQRTLAGTKWEVLRGWHVLRHSFISAFASRGIDQRIIDEWVGHSTEQQRKRYRHLYPSIQQEAIRSVFG